MQYMNVRRRARLLVSQAMLILVSASVLLVACGGAQGQDATPTTAPQPTEDTSTITPGQPERGQAMVESVDVLLMESFPVQISVIARGQLPDGCTQIDEVITQQSGDTFRIAVTTVRLPDQVCTQALVPFEQTIALDAVGLEAGTYNVSVNGVTSSFTLDVDNVLPESETPSAASGIGGLVWHDLCEQTGTTLAENATPVEGCVVGPDGETLQANGVFDPGEPGIPGVTVQLLAGDCTLAAPGDELVAVTDESGAYRFTDISPDTFCVFLDTVSDANVDVLEEGVLTFPTNNGVPTNSITVMYDAANPPDDINFGYDFRFLPLAEVSADCEDSFMFVQDLTVPDDTVFPPDTEFIASWRLRNNGTCPWTPDYGIAFIGGDAMGITTTVPIETSVAPGQEADLSVTLTSPSQPGTYRSNWQLSNAAGETFGVNAQPDDAFWVQIVVDEAAVFVGTPAPGSSVIGGVVWEDVCFLTNGNPSRGCVETEEGSGFYRADGSLNFGEQPLPGITLILGRGACPEGGVPAPADRIGTQVSGDDGSYRFEGLDAGIYCVSIDALSPENVDLLIPGNWTYPAPGTGRAGIRLALGEERLNVDFGWDFRE